MSWKRHLTILLATFAGLNAALYLFVVAMNPYGNLPSTVLGEHMIMDTNQRYQYPAIVRSGRYDSMITGTSTSRLFEPKAFEGLLGGRFANLALDSGTAWEQTRMTELFLHTVKTPHALVVGLDWVWCVAAPEKESVTFRGFPEWMFDDSRWNDLPYMYNLRALEISGRRLAAAVTGKKARIARDGYEVFLPPESEYDPAKVAWKLYGNGPHVHPTPKLPPDQPDAAERAGWTFPALDWLQRLVADTRWHKVLLVWPPVHVNAQPRPGTVAAYREQACKDKVAVIASAHGVPVVDFRIASQITREDSNYWDPLHYRVGIAGRIEADLARALPSANDDASGDWVVPKLNRRVQ